MYPVLFIFEIILLWRLSRALNSRFFRLLPMPLYVMLFLPGTFLHELSHFIFAKLLFVQVGKFSLWPEKKEREIVLGSVSIEQTNIIKRLLIGAAPVIFGLTLILSVVYFVVTRDLTGDWRVIFVLGYTIFVIANTMFSSKKDMEGAWKVVLFGLLVGVVAYLLGMRVSFEVDANVFRTTSLYLLAPVAIDALILAAVSLRRR